MYWLLVRSGLSTFFGYEVCGLVGGLGSWQKCKSQHSWEEQVLLAHTVQPGETEASLARAGHCYRVRNSFPDETL